jgi:hypothetical protein
LQRRPGLASWSASRCADTASDNGKRPGGGAGAFPSEEKGRAETLGIKMRQNL